MLALGELGHPRPRRRCVAPVQRDGQALGFHVDAGGRFGRGLRHHDVDRARPAGGLLRARQRAFEAVEAYELHPGGRSEHVPEERGGPARDHGHERELRRQRGQERRHAGDGACSDGVRHDGRQRAVEVEEERAVRRVGGQRFERGGERVWGRLGHRPARRQAPGAVARSWPTITITSRPVVELSGVAELIGSTCAGFTPMAVAMDAAACC